MAQSASTDTKVASTDLRRILKFLVKVVQVVEQAFADVYSILIDIKYLDAGDVGTSRIREIQKELDLVLARSTFRDVEEICSRLHHLTQQYDETIASVVSQLERRAEWDQVFAIINEHEGAILNLVRSTLYELNNQLAGLQISGDLVLVQQMAAARANALRQALDLLVQLRNRILGLSDHSGFLEMTTADRPGIVNEINVMLDQADRRLITINTGGGAYIGGDVDTGGGAFVGRDAFTESPRDPSE
jgi:hypothetical protein